MFPVNQIQKEETITSLELAEMSGKPHYDIMKAIRKMEEAWVELDQGNFSLISYTDKNNRQKPMYSLTKTESLYIASKFNDTVRAKLVIRWEELEKNKSQVKPMTRSEYALWSAQMHVETERKLLEQEKRIEKIEAKMTTRPDCYSIAGYASLIGKPVLLKKAATLGRQASSICKTLGIEVEKLPDPRFGTVNVYPVDVLKGVFANQ